MQCQQCGCPLANANAICAACDLELSTSSHLYVGAHPVKGRYRCPACSGSFESWTTTVSPSNASWYTPQLHVPACPLCTNALRWERDREPAQLPLGLQGVAMGMLSALWFTTPTPLLHEIREHIGNWFVVLIPPLLSAMFFVAVRPSMRGTGQGVGHFVLGQHQPSGKFLFWALMTGAAILISVRAAPQTAELPLWCAWIGLGAAGCLAAVLWRRSAQRRKRSHTPDPAAPSPTHLS